MWTVEIYDGNEWLYTIETINLNQVDGIAWVAKTNGQRAVIKYNGEIRN